MVVTPEDVCRLECSSFCISVVARLLHSLNGVFQPKEISAPTTTISTNNRIRGARFAKHCTLRSRAKPWTWTRPGRWPRPTRRRWCSCRRWCWRGNWAASVNIKHNVHVWEVEVCQVRRIGRPAVYRAEIAGCSLPVRIRTDEEDVPIRPSIGRIDFHNQFGRPSRHSCH